MEWLYRLPLLCKTHRFSCSQLMLIKLLRNNYWGSYLMTADGIILNDEMGDFSSPGETNDFGFAASPANYIVCFPILQTRPLLYLFLRLVESALSPQSLPLLPKTWKPETSSSLQEALVEAEVRILSCHHLNANSTTYYYSYHRDPPTPLPPHRSRPQLYRVRTPSSLARPARRFHVL